MLHLKPSLIESTGTRFVQLFRDKTGVGVNLIVLGFSLLGYLAGIACLFSSHWVINMFGVLLSAQALIISAYLLHEFSHYSIFKSPHLNQRWGTLMTWINGSCYSTFEEIRNKHMHHHVDRADVISFDLRGFIVSRPRPLRLVIWTLEWAYIPAAEIIMHLLVVVLPFITPRWYYKRLRLVAVTLIRVSLFAVIAWFSAKALVLYMLAYCIMLTALRFADAYQHTYDAFVVGDAGKKQDTFADDGKLRDYAYEQANTYSNLASLHYPWLNLIFLNFPYHNAHHEKPVVPWYQLPELHEKLYGKLSESAPVVPMGQLLKSYHKYRLTRLESNDYGTLEFKAGGADNFIGAVGVSFLTAI